MTLISALVLCVAAIGAGAMNALAGGGSFITFPALLFTGLDPRAANITSTIALFPGQIVTGWAGRRLVSGAGGLSFVTLFVISLAGGVLGAFLLLATPASFFARLVPWLVLFATGVFAWGSFFRRTPARAVALPRQVAGGLQLLIAIYGGYFGGGIGFLMLAVLTAVGLAVRNAGATKNVLASCMNAAAALVFVFAPGVGWLQVLILSVGSAIGGWFGAWLLQRVNEKLLRGFVITVGVALTIGLFLRG